MPIDPVRTIPRNKYTRDVGRGALFADDVAVLVHVEDAFEELRVGNVSDGDKKARALEHALGIGLQVSRRAECLGDGQDRRWNRTE